jgi:hypothetical protein
VRRRAGIKADDRLQRRIIDAGIAEGMEAPPHQISQTHQMKVSFSERSLGDLKYATPLAATVQARGISPASLGPKWSGGVFGY